MKVLLVTSSFRGGGITSYAHEVVNCFSNGNDMSVIIGDDTQLPFDRSNGNWVSSPIITLISFPLEKQFTTSCA